MAMHNKPSSTMGIPGGTSRTAHKTTYNPGPSSTAGIKASGTKSASKTCAGSPAVSLGFGQGADPAKVKAQ